MWRMTKGSFIPDIDPAKHTLMINGLVDWLCIFTMADLKRLLSVSQFHFIECSGNSHGPIVTTVQEFARADQQRRMDRGAPFQTLS